MNLYEILQNSGRVGEGMTHFERLFAQKVGGGKISEITGTLPLRYIGNGKPLTDYLISGNAFQDGTPSSVAPVDAVGCGVWDETRQSYKLPITVNSTEYPIYLGQVPTTRRIKKLVLTGEENWGINAPTKVFYCGISQALIRAGVTTSACTHYKALANLDNYSYLFDNSCCIRWNDSVLWIRDLSRSNVDDFKSYLQQQYAAGHPVTVWYVLVNPTTGIVNEPLRKIGDYADTISFAQAGVTIPTVNGANVLDMTSPVKPSEVYIKGKGIKPTGYAQLVDKNGVRILDKNNVRILVHGQ